MDRAGTIKKDVRTKNLVPRLVPGDIAVIDHADMDRVSAESLASTGIVAVVNASKSITGLYPNVGPRILIESGITLVNDVGRETFDELVEGERAVISGGNIIMDARVVGSGEVLTLERVESLMSSAQTELDTRLDSFTRNTLTYLDDDRDILQHEMWIPPTDIRIRGRQALIVVRGYDYKEDLRALRAYIAEMKPILIGVDGGADALLEEKYKPDIIIGDMDSVSDRALESGAEIIAHAYADGSCPAAERLDRLGVEWTSWALSATSEDLALLLAYHSGADLIVAVGTHANLIEYLDKGRQGMASSFLVRLKVGEKLVDAKGVNKLYHTAPSLKHAIPVLLAAIAAIGVIVMTSDVLRSSLRLVLLSIRSYLFS